MPLIILRCQLRCQQRHQLRHRLFSSLRRRPCCWSVAQTTAPSAARLCHQRRYRPSFNRAVSHAVGRSGSIAIYCNVRHAVTITVSLASTVDPLWVDCAMATLSTVLSAAPPAMSSAVPTIMLPVASSSTPPSLPSTVPSAVPSTVQSLAPPPWPPPRSRATSDTVAHSSAGLAAMSRVILRRQPRRQPCRQLRYQLFSSPSHRPGH